MTDLQKQLDELRAELTLLHAQIAANEWKHMQARFHGFDAIKDDNCPCCGGPVVVNHESASRATLEVRQ